MRHLMLSWLRGVWDESDAPAAVLWALGEWGEAGWGEEY